MSDVKIIFIHGALADGRIWEDHVNFFKGRYDSEGYSFSSFIDPSDQRFGIKHFADELSLYVAQFENYKKIYLVAWSYGADVVINMLHRHRVKLSGVTLYEPGHPGLLTGAELNYWVNSATDIFSAVLHEHNSGNPEAAIKQLIDGTSGVDGYFDSLHDEYKALFLSKAFTLGRQLTQSDVLADLSKKKENLQFPINVLYGEKTLPMFYLPSHAASRMFSGEEASEVAGQSHMFPLDFPDYFCREVIKYIE